jgi:RNA polymerase sigma-70 factor (TIGR02960 family)
MMTGRMPTLDESTFAQRVEPHRRELHVHCYRMLGSFDEAEDLVQETLLRAWRKWDTFDEQPDSSLRAWLYRIASNACIDAIRRRKRQVQSLTSFDEMPWIQPYPDRLLDEVVAPESAPEVAVVSRETIELAYLAAMQLLPARQRAVLILRDVLGWSAAETAEMLDLTVASANSALQRARATLTAQSPVATARRATTGLSEDEQVLLARFIDAHERGDAAEAVAIARDDIRITMPPNTLRFDGIDGFAPLLARAFDVPTMGEWRLVPTAANRMPTAASYLRAPGDDTFRAFKFDVLRVVDGGIAEITTFGVRYFPAFGLPPTL